MRYHELPLIQIDLDSYFYTSTGIPCTVYYGHRSCNSGTSTATLDVDARNGYGPGNYK
jgi:uncharacterized protein YfaP (DUF2135 family)